MRRPLHGDRVRETTRGGIEGHVHAIRHTAKGLEARVYSDGEIAGYWISADDLVIVRKAPEPLTECKFLGWDYNQTEAP